MRTRAVADHGQLALQLGLFISDRSGLFLSGDDLGFDLTRADLSDVMGVLGVFDFTPDRQVPSGDPGVDVANLNFSVTGIHLATPPESTPAHLPEPASLALVALAMGGLAFQRHGIRRTPRH